MDGSTSPHIQRSAVRALWCTPLSVGIHTYTIQLQRCLFPGYSNNRVAVNTEPRTIFPIGSYVLTLNPRGAETRLHSMWLGQFLVVSYDKSEYTIKNLPRRKIVMFMQVSWDRLGSTQLPNHRLTQLVATTWIFLLKRSFSTLEINRNLLQWNIMLNGWTTIQTIIHGNHGSPCAPQINFIRICAKAICCT